MWVWYSLSFALLSSLGTFIIKKLIKKIDYLPLLYAFLIFNIPLTFFLVLFVGGIPKTTPNFYIYMGISGFLDTIAFVLAFLAISKSPISILAPISSFSPVFTTLIAGFTLHEIPTPLKFTGILIVVLGSYFLNISDIKKGITAPIKSLFASTSSTFFSRSAGSYKGFEKVLDKGVLLFLAASLIWSVTPIFQKKAIFETTPQIPLFASVIGMCFGFVFLTPFVFKKVLPFVKEIKANIKWFAVNGIMTSVGQALAYAAFSLTYLGYATSVFRISIIFTIILGAIFFKEKRIKERLFGAIVMLIGVMLLAV